jgi:hypothetical protein
MMALALMLAQAASTIVPPEDVREHLSLSILCIGEGAAAEKEGGWIDIVSGPNIPSIEFARSDKGASPYLEKGVIKSADIEVVNGSRVMKLSIAGLAQGGDARMTMRFAIPSVESSDGKTRLFECFQVPPPAPAGTKK